MKSQNVYFARQGFCAENDLPNALEDLLEDYGYNIVYKISEADIFVAAVADGGDDYLPKEIEYFCIFSTLDDTPPRLIVLYDAQTELTDELYSVVHENGAVGTPYADEDDAKTSLISFLETA